MKMNKVIKWDSENQNAKLLEDPLIDLCKETFH